MELIKSTKQELAKHAEHKNDLEAKPPAEPIVSSLYVHVPFCAHKCVYCAFYSETPAGNLIDRYIAALIREMEMAAPNCRLQTVYFGGGTPSLLNCRQWQLILQAMDRLGLVGAAEWTVECNPATISFDKAKLWRDYGVNRVSMGIQSLDDDLLDRLGRIHSRAMAFRSFDLLRQAGFDNLNLDLMFAIPGQTMTVWRQTLREAIAMNSEHLSSYEITYEEDTPLFEQLAAGRIGQDDDLACNMYEEWIAAAIQAGFVQYEVSNLARHQSTAPPSIPPSRACQHNINYWRGGAFFGLGPSATTYVGGVRTKNVSNTRLYCGQLEHGHRAVDSSEQLSPLARAGETAAFGLRLTAGWPFDLFQQITGFDLRQEWAADMEQMIRLGYGTADSHHFQLTQRGLRFADWVAEQFIRIDPS
ncbi:MAG: radical SAM family heme chaperone HemW [Candidatus Omnitrophica bacterium]|nr:radical SAM family heme chaperone HemW [Candidatus Omnitrophota bacterium]